MPAASDTPEAAAYEKPDEGSDDEEKMGLSEDEAEAPAPELGTPANSVTPLTSACQLVNGNRPKRRRSEDGESDGVGLDEVGSTPRKRLRSETPPPPPPPPEENFLDMTPPSSAHNLIKGADFKAMTQNGHMMDEDICKNPPRPAPVGSVYTDHEETVDLNGGGASPMFLNGVGNSPSDGDEGGMDKSNLAIHGMGIGQMPEVEVHQGH